MATTRSHGVSRIDVLVIVACAGLLILITSAVLGQTQPEVGEHAQVRPRSLKDGKQLKHIHQAMIVFAREFGGVFPSPGSIDRLPVKIGGRLQEIPGRGEKDITQNTTANLYSALIMQNYFEPATVISPVERNPNVKVRSNYDWEIYNPVEDVYWDQQFKADLVEVSHVSYAHMVLFGKRVDAQWRDTMAAKFPVLSNRGPKDGKLDPKSYTCGPHGHWAGNVVYNDNQVRLEMTTAPDGLFFESNGQRKQDNLFAFDDGIGGVDAILTFTKDMTPDGPIIQHD